MTHSIQPSNDLPFAIARCTVCNSNSLQNPANFVVVYK